MPTVNGHETPIGCYIEGHWGQYANDRLADIAEGFGFSFATSRTDDPRLCRQWADEAEENGDPIASANHWERAIWATDAIEQWLNDHTDGGYWGWFDGEFFLTDETLDDDAY